MQSLLSSINIIVLLVLKFRQVLKGMRTFLLLQPQILNFDNVLVGRSAGHQADSRR